MTKNQKHRAIMASILLIATVSIVALVMFALRNNINLFYSPLQIANGEAPLNKRIRVGGMVRIGSIKRGENLQVEFIVTDYAKDLKINYSGILPDLFREGQGVVALGKLQDNLFVADQILAKHDEKYMPPEVAEALHQDK